MSNPLRGESEYATIDLRSLSADAANRLMDALEPILARQEPPLDVILNDRDRSMEEQIDELCDGLDRQREQQRKGGR